MLNFFTRWIYEKISSFLRLPGNVEFEYWSKMGYQNNPVNISFPFFKSTHMEIIKERVDAVRNAAKLNNLIYEARKKPCFPCQPCYLLSYPLPLLLIAMSNFFPFVNLITLTNKGGVQGMSKFL